MSFNTKFIDCKDSNGQFHCDPRLNQDEHIPEVLLPPPRVSYMYLVTIYYANSIVHANTWIQMNSL